LRFSPGAVGTERFQMKRGFVAIKRMAVVTAAAAVALFDENRLDTRGKELEIRTLCSKDRQQKERRQTELPETHGLYYGSAFVLLNMKCRINSLDTVSSLRRAGTNCQLRAAFSASRTSCWFAPRDVCSMSATEPAGSTRILRSTGTSCSRCSPTGTDGVIWRIGRAGTKS
jgi:hypothetical protein